MMTVVTTMTTPDTLDVKWTAYATGAQRHERVYAHSCTHFLKALQLPQKLPAKAEGEKIKIEESTEMRGWNRQANRAGDDAGCEETSVKQLTCAPSFVFRAQLVPFAVLSKGHIHLPHSHKNKPPTVTNNAGAWQRHPVHCPHPFLPASLLAPLSESFFLYSSAFS